MKIGFGRVFVTDFKKSLEFYTNELGIQLDYSGENHWAQFKSGADASLFIESCAPDHNEQRYGLAKNPDGNVLTLMEFTGYASVSASLKCVQGTAVAFPSLHLVQESGSETSMGICRAA